MCAWPIGAAAGMLLVVGCGGLSQREGSHGTPSIGGVSGEAAGALHGGSGGSAGAFDGGGGGNANAAGTLPIGDAGTSGTADSPCSNHALRCDASATYVDISDTTTARLAYSPDASSSALSGDTCQILATGTSNCGLINVRLFACSAPRGGGVCLDTASSEPHYTDLSGKRWTMLTLSGSTAQPNGAQTEEGLVDLDLTLSLSDNSTTRTLAVHAHVCASIAATLMICR